MTEKGGEVTGGKRFEFGKNWNSFCKALDEDRISIAQQYLSEMLGKSRLEGCSFLDVGCGSGLNSLVAHRLGAKVFSFDFDEFSVSCTRELKRRFADNTESWEVVQGSILDKTFLNKLQKHGIVYCWGVLHHTGEMWRALDNCIDLCSEDGLLYIAVYNDQGAKSRIWWLIKWIYNTLPALLRQPFAYLGFMFVQMMVLLKYALRFNLAPVIGRLFDYKRARGMKLQTDIKDWYGGFPYEYATYEVLVNFVCAKGFKLLRGKKVTSHGCHELVFQRSLMR